MQRMGMEPKTPSEDTGSGSGVIPSSVASKQKSDHFKALLSELEYLEKRGDVIDKRDVEKAIGDIGHQIKTLILRIGDAVVDAVMAAKTPAQQRKVAKDVTLAALTEAADDMLRLSPAKKGKGEEE